MNKFYYWIGATLVLVGIGMLLFGVGLAVIALWKAHWALGVLGFVTSTWAMFMLLVGDGRE